MFYHSSLEKMTLKSQRCVKIYQSEIHRLEREEEREREKGRDRVRNNALIFCNVTDP